jgi:hypothetical protein
VLATLSRWRPRVQIPSGPHRREAPALRTGASFPSGASAVTQAVFQKSHPVHTPATFGQTPHAALPGPPECTGHEDGLRLAITPIRRRRSRLPSRRRQFRNAAGTHQGMGAGSGGRAQPGLAAHHRGALLSAHLPTATGSGRFPGVPQAVRSATGLLGRPWSARRPSKFPRRTPSARPSPDSVAPPRALRCPPVQPDPYGASNGRRAPVRPHGLHIGWPEPAPEGSCASERAVRTKNPRS